MIDFERCGPWHGGFVKLVGYGLPRKEQVLSLPEGYLYPGTRVRGNLLYLFQQCCERPDMTVDGGYRKPSSDKPSTN